MQPLLTQTLVSLASSVNIILASMDLQLVRLLRQAMAPACGPATALGPAPNPPPRAGGRAASGVLNPTPRPKFHPQPRIEPRLTIHPKPAESPRPVDPPPLAPEQARLTKSPIQPPWKVRLWEIPLPPPPIIKVILRRPDVVNRGVLFDIFV